MLSRDALASEGVLVANCAWPTTIATKVPAAGLFVAGCERDSQIATKTPSGASDPLRQLTRGRAPHPQPLRTAHNALIVKSDENLMVGGRGAAPPHLPAMRHALSAVEYVVAEVLHFQDGGVRPAGQRLVEMRLDYFADNDVVIALFDNSRNPALDRADGVD